MLPRAKGVNLGPASSWHVASKFPRKRPTNLCISDFRHIKILDESARWSARSHSEMFASVGWVIMTSLGCPIKMILHQHAEGVLLMVADPFPNKDRSEFTWKSLKMLKVPGATFQPLTPAPVCRWPAIGQRLLRLVCRQFPCYFLKPRNSQMQWNPSFKFVMMTDWFIYPDPYFLWFVIIPIKLGSIIIEIPVKL